MPQRVPKRKYVRLQISLLHEKSKIGHLASEGAFGAWGQVLHHLEKYELKSFQATVISRIGQGTYCPRFWMVQGVHYASWLQFQSRDSGSLCAQ